MSRVLRVQHVSVGIEAGREAEARDFYAGALGLTEKPRPLGLKALPVIWFDAGDDEHEVHLLATEGYTPPKGNHLCLQVDDLAANVGCQPTPQAVHSDDIELRQIGPFG